MKNLIKEYLEYEGYKNTLFALDREDGLIPSIQSNNDATNKVESKGDQKRIKRLNSTQENFYESFLSRKESEPQYMNGGNGGGASGISEVSKHRDRLDS